MSQSELVLKTYREITTKLEKPYYVLEAIPANAGNNQILYSSSRLKEVTGLTQYELSSDSNQFFNAIHPDFIEGYFESNKKLLEGTQKAKRIYLIKNKDTGEFVPVEELATSRLNQDRNSYEIYCSIRSIDESMDINDETDIEMVSRAFSKLSNLTVENRSRIFEITNHFVESMAEHFGLNGCRFYGYNAQKKELSIFADIQNKVDRKQFESATRIRTRAIIPKYSEDNLLFKILLEKQFKVLEERSDILEILKAHTDVNIIKKLAGTAIRMYNMKSFGLLPICCPDGRIVGLVTFSSSKRFNEEQKKNIHDFTTTNSFVFTSLLGEICHEEKNSSALPPK